jgi:hypothetical protein
MILDATTLFSAAQAVTATVASTNIIDLGQPGTVFGAATAIARDVGKGATVPIAIRVVENFNNLTSITVTVETDDNSGFSSPTMVFNSPTFVLADLQAGARHLLPDALPVGTAERYVRLKYTLAGTTPTTGKITAGIAAGLQTNG